MFIEYIQSIYRNMKEILHQLQTDHEGRDKDVYPL